MNIFKKLDINPTNMNLYYQAFTHSSYTNENPSYPNYERLEFLGDAVLEIIISDYLYKEWHLEEGTMTKMRANYVCEKACATYARDLNFESDVRIGNNEEINDTIIADIFEAFIGALYLDKGFDFTSKLVMNIIKPYIDKNVNFLIDYKSALQEKIQSIKKTVTYEVIEESGPAHNKKFTSVVKVDDIILGKGTGNSKKASEQEAAKDALSKEVE
ncbi:MAG: ribonuclease III [Bacilli bacterium]|nr:ribonuclease III [Bacilli bacterium]